MNGRNHLPSGLAPRLVHFRCLVRRRTEKSRRRPPEIPIIDFIRFTPRHNPPQTQILETRNCPASPVFAPPPQPPSQNWFGPRSLRSQVPAACGRPAGPDSRRQGPGPTQAQHLARRRPATPAPPALATNRSNDHASSGARSQQPTFESTVLDANRRESKF